MCDLFFQQSLVLLYLVIPSVSLWRTQIASPFIASTSKKIKSERGLFEFFCRAFIFPQILPCLPSLSLPPAPGGQLAMSPQPRQEPHTHPLFRRPLIFLLFAFIFFNNRFFGGIFSLSKTMCSEPVETLALAKPLLVTAHFPPKWPPVRVWFSLLSYWGQAILVFQHLFSYLQTAASIPFQFFLLVYSSLFTVFKQPPHTLTL